MTFIKFLKNFKSKKNKATLLKYAGYSSIKEYMEDFNVSTQKEAYKRILDDYNKFVDIQREKKVTNPITGAQIKLFDVITYEGRVRDKYKDKIDYIDEKLVLKKSKKKVKIIDSSKDNIIIIDNATKSTGKFDSSNDLDKYVKDNNTNINNYKVVNTIGMNVDAEVSISITFIWIPSDTELELTENIIGIFTPEQLSSESFIRNLLNFGAFKIGIIDRIISVKYHTTINNKSLELENMELKLNVPLKINSLYNEVVDKDFKHCIHDYLIQNYPKKCKKDIYKLKNVNSIYDWCVTNKIKLLAFDICGKPIKTHYPTKKNRNKALNFIAYNTHLYPIKNKFLKKTNNIIDNIVTLSTTDMNKKLIELLENHILPSNIGYDGSQIINFTYIHDKKQILVTDNIEYSRCKKILSLFGLEDKLYPQIKVSNLGSIFEKNYIKSDINSFFPYGAEFNKGGYNFINNDLDDSEEFVTIDKNKCYSNELFNLTYLIKTDIRLNKFRKVNDSNEFDIKLHYLYIVEIEQESLLMPNNNIYCGKLVSFARSQGLKFVIKEELETKTEINGYKNMINELYNKLDNKDFKQIINIMIGKFERSGTHQDIVNFKKFMDENELKTFDGHVKKIGNYYAGFEKKRIYHLHNKKPIAIQVKDNSRMTMYNMINCLGIKQDEIKQLKTDSITYKKINDDYKEYINNYITGWKIENFKPMKDPKIDYNPVPTFEYEQNDKGYICFGYAGSGKTHKIIHNDIPKYGNCYIVITPSHSTLEEYRHLKLNCDVIHKYLYSNELPSVQNIIIDEIGMIDYKGWEFLYKCKLEGKNII
jgi:hypothetical protein